jgi:methylated-DNA-protein-cysteine methyltransferase-like protein
MDWEDVLNCLERIPPGRVATYGDVARRYCSSARAVGTCLNKIREKFRGRRVPEDLTHRVVEDDGSLPDRPGGLDQRSKLDREGVCFRDDGTVDLTKCRANL